MIIKTNLASKPTRNYTLYFISCVLLTVIVIAFTIYNVSTLLSAHEKTSQLGEKIAEQQRLRSEAQSQAAAMRSRITAIKTPEFITETEFLNNAIKRRVFSWTSLFDHFESLFPNNVKMISVYPDISGDEIRIRMEVAVKDLNDIVELARLLQSSEYFSEVVFRSESQEQDSLLRFSMSLVYNPEPLHPPASGADAGKKDQEPSSQQEKAL